MKSAIIFVSVLCLVITVVGANSHRRMVRTTNSNPAYQRWNRTSIPYYIDPDFSPAEASMIQLAIATIVADLNNCVTFTQVAASALVFKIKFTALTGAAGSQPQSYCYSYPGINIAMKNTSLEQVVSLARGSSGCWDGTLHSLMKYIAIVLGKRNEHQRGDRASSITMNNANVAVASAYTPYVLYTDAYWNLFNYDLCSITHNQPGDFATSPAAPAFTVNPAVPPGFVPKLNHLSLIDCKLLSMMYSCDQSACSQTPCALVTTTPASTTTNTASTTTNTASTTTNTASTTTNTASTPSTTTNTASTTTGTTPSTTTNTASTTTGTTPSTTTNTASTTTGSTSTTASTSTTTVFAG